MISDDVNEQISRLRGGQMTQYRPAEPYLEPQFVSGQLVTFAPMSGSLNEGDLVLCVLNDCSYFAMVKSASPDSYLVGNNNNGTIFGMASDSDIVGVVILVQD